MYMKKVPSKHTSSSNRHKTQPSRNHIGIKRNFYRYRHIPLVMPRRFHIRREHSEFWVMTYLLYSWGKKASCVYYFFLYHSWYSSKLNQNLQAIYVKLNVLSYHCCKYHCWSRKNYIELYQNNFKLRMSFKEPLFRTLCPWDQFLFESMYP